MFVGETISSLGKQASGDIKLAGGSSQTETSGVRRCACVVVHVHVQPPPRMCGCVACTCPRHSTATCAQRDYKMCSHSLMLFAAM